MRSISNLWATAALSLSLFTSCGGKVEDPGSDSSTHFFSRCDADQECGEGLACECNRCTLRCTEASDCGAFSTASCALATTLDSCTLETQICVPQADAIDAGTPADSAEGTATTDAGAPTDSAEGSATTDAELSVREDDGTTDTAETSDATDSAGNTAPSPSSNGTSSDVDDGSTDVSNLEPETVTPFPLEDIPVEPDGGAEEPERGCLGQVDCPWSERAPLPLPSTGQTAVAFDDILYVIGGLTSEDRADLSGDGIPPVDPLRFTNVLAYDSAADLWTARAPMPVGLYSLAAHRIGDLIYVFAGYNMDGFANVVQVYDPATDSWDQRAPSSTYRYIFASGVVDGKAYIIGGFGTVDDAPSSGQDWENKDDVEIFDPTTNSWSRGTATPAPIDEAASCTFGSKIFIFGGATSNLTSIYDASTDSWSVGTTPPSRRKSHQCVPVGSSLFLFGGRDNRDALSTVEQYDPATDTWATFSPIPTARYWFAAAAVGHNVFVFGGEQYVRESTLGNNFGLLSSVEVFTVE